MSIAQGEPFTLECVARGNPQPSIRIETPGTRRIADFNQRQRQARFEISYFTAENAGDYSCIAENEYGEQAIERFRVNLLPSGQPPFILVEPKSIEANEGGSLTINYTYTGSEPVQINVQLYSAPNRPISSLLIDKNSKTIELRRLTKDMTGQYIIEASNPFGSVKDYFYLTVNEG
jgi:hypothetical protein